MLTWESGLYRKAGVSMFEMFLYGGILLVMAAAFLFGGEAGTTVGVLLVIFAIVVALIKFPGLAIILVGILVVVLITSAIRRRLNVGLDGLPQEETDSNAIGCLRLILGGLLALPGGIAVFITMVMNDFKILAALAWIACLLGGLKIMGIGSDAT